MIHYIKGKLAMKFDGGAVVETGGIGYEIHMPDNSAIYLASEGDSVTVYTVMMVREDDVSLFGFSDKASLELFNKLITVNGVGAKAALSVLSAMPLNDVKRAIVFEDAKTLTRANGIGKKIAERIVLELKDKIGDVAAFGADEGAVFSEAQSGLSAAEDERSEAINALISLGYSKSEAVMALGNVTETGLSTSEYIRQALKNL